ncbi:MAG: ABC transporter substrate-binding protein [Acidimicrobiales bacterium]
MKAHVAHKRRDAAVASALAAAALVAAACGTTKSPAAVVTPGVSAHTIVLGTTTPLTGAAAPGYDEIAPAVNAVFQYINSKGGVYGRKIKYIIENDQYDPTLTVQKTRLLVQNDNIFADIGALGTPTQLAVEAYLKAQGVPDIFVESGCACWSTPSEPDVFGFQPNYIVEGKILGQYVKQTYSGDKVGYLYQDDEFGQDGVKGLNEEIPSSAVVGSQNYQGTSAGLAAGLGDQITALKAAGANVVVLYTIPAATALALLAAASIGYAPHWVVSSVGADPPTLTGLLSSFSKGAAGEALLNGIVSNSYFPPESDSSNPWVQLMKTVLGKYDKGYHWDGNSEYGAALGFTVVQALEAAGKNLTRAGLVAAIEDHGAGFASSGLVPFAYSKTDHYGYSGSEIVKIENGVISAISPTYVSTNTGPITTYTGGEKPIPALFKG